MNKNNNVERVYRLMGYSFAYSLLLIETGSYAKAVTILKDLSEMDYPPAQFKMGTLYDNGIGVEQSDTEAFHWYLKAAENGDTGAMNDLAVCYKNGQGCERSLEKALHWYNKSAEAGNVDGMANLAANLLLLFQDTQDRTFLIMANHWAMESMNKGSNKGFLILNEIHKYW